MPQSEQFTFIKTISGSVLSAVTLFTAKPAVAEEISCVATDLDGTEIVINGPSVVNLIDTRSDVRAYMVDCIPDTNIKIIVLHVDTGGRHEGYRYIAVLPDGTLIETGSISKQLLERFNIPRETTFATMDNIIVVGVEQGVFPEDLRDFDDAERDGVDPNRGPVVLLYNTIVQPGFDAGDIDVSDLEV